MANAPTQKFVTSQRIPISYWDWGNEGAPPLVLVHGGRDHARQWDRIAEALCDTYHVIALDLRGHGDSGWSPGGTYGLPDNAIDVIKVIEAVGAPARVLAHSYGGAVSLIAASAYPEHFTKLAVLEGTNSLNPRDEAEMGPRWLRAWADRVRSYEASVPFVYPTIEAAAERVASANPRLPADFVPHLTTYAAKPVEGGYIWKYDWWVNGRTSMEIRREELPRFWAVIECPVLLVFARESRVGQQQDAGHWLHHDQPAAALDAIRPFFAG